MRLQFRSRILSPGGLARFKLGALSTVLMCISCAGGHAASQIVRTPDYAPKDQVISTVVANQERPLVVEWPAADRGDLETQMRRGIVVVRYSNRTMQILEQCYVAASYRYQGFTRKQDHLEVQDVDSLYAAIPLGAARLEGELKNSGVLDVDMLLVGQWEAGKTSARREELQGFCDGATHIMSAMTVGAFTIFAGADARLGAGANGLGFGVGSASTATRRTLRQDGNEFACASSTPTDLKPPENCGAPIRVELALLATNDIRPSCPNGMKWDGSACTPLSLREAINWTETWMRIIRVAMQNWQADNNTTSCTTVSELVQEKHLEPGAPAVDLWGHGFVLRCSEDEITVSSAGPDGRLGTADDFVFPKSH